MSDLVYRRPCPHGNEVCGVEYQHPYHGWMLCPGSIDLVLDPDKVLVYVNTARYVSVADVLAALNPQPRSR